MTYETFLSRLDKVRSTGNDKWVACCPAHQDKSPSMSIAVEPVTGKLLVHCFAGCPAADIVAAVGLTLSDLFPDDPKPMRDEERRWAVQREKDYLAIVQAAHKRGERIDPNAINRAELAIRRIRAVEGQ